MLAVTLQLGLGPYSGMVLLTILFAVIGALVATLFGGIVVSIVVLVTLPSVMLMMLACPWVAVRFSLAVPLTLTLARRRIVLRGMLDRRRTVRVPVGQRSDDAGHGHGRADARVGLAGGWPARWRRSCDSGRHGDRAARLPSF